MRSIILVPCQGAGERDLLFLAEAQQLLLDELAAVIRINADDREGEDFQDMYQRGEHVLLGFVGTERFTVHPVLI